jgi:hypothetical protein
MKRQDILASRTLRATLVVMAAVATAAGVVSAGATKQPSSTNFVANCLRLTPGVSGEKLERRERECRMREAVSSGVSAARDKERKAELRERQAELRALTTSPPVAPVARLTGLVIDSHGPIGTNETFHATAHWAGHVDQEWLLVYAGARANPATNQNTASELRIYREPGEVNSGEPNVFLGSYAPPGGGDEPLTISAASGDVLSVRTGTGANLTFNVGRRAFSSSP